MTRPNILIFLSDQHNPQIMGCGGDSVVRTPHLDQLAGQGIIFDNAYCAAPVCVPSRMTLLTAQYPSDIGVWDNSCTLNPQMPTFAHSLSLAGYETVLCGRMHFAGPDEHHGFERRLLGDVSGAMEPGYNPNELFERVIPCTTTGQTAVTHGTVGAGRSTYMAYDEAVTGRAIEYLNSRHSERPFCLVVGYLSPHNPYICSQRLFEEYMDKIGVPEFSAVERNSLHPAIAQLRQTRNCDDITPDQTRRARAAYYGLVTQMDENIGQVLAALESTTAASNTAIAYTSDHGDMAGAHGLWWKETFYEGACRVPLIWSWPQKFRSNARVESICSLLDIGPTCIDLADAQNLPLARGSRLKGLFEGEQREWPGEAFAETFARGQRPARMIRSGDWKLNWYHGYDYPQLFNLRDDPNELVDLGRDAGVVAIRDQLTARIREGWSGERIEASIAERSIVASWNQQITSDESELWSVPQGSNELFEVAT